MKFLHFTFQAPPFWSNGYCRRHIFSSSQKSNISRTSAIAASLGIVSSVKASSTSPKESSEFQSQQFSFSTSDIANIGSDNGIEAPEQPSTPQIGHRHHRRWCLCTKSLSGVEVSRLNAKKSIFYFQGYSGTFGIKVALKLGELRRPWLCYSGASATARTCARAPPSAPTTPGSTSMTRDRWWLLTQCQSSASY